MSPQQQKDANELANYWRSSWQKVSESMASSGLSQDGIAIMAANQAQVDMMSQINQANINEDLAKKADRQFGLDSLSKVLDLADKGLIDHSQVNAMLDALQAGDMGTAGAIMDSFKPVMPQGNYANMEKALATASLYDESHVLYTMSTPYGDGSVDLKPVYMTLQDGTKTLAKSTDPRLTTLLNSGKKIESKFDPATNTVTYTQTDEAIPEGQTPVIAQDGTIKYSNPDAGTAPTYDRTNSDTVPAADYDKWKSAVTGKEGQTPLSESDIPALADFANKGSANAISDLVNVISANAKAFSANIDSLPESVKPKAIDAYAKNIPETQLSLPSLGPIAPGQYFKNGGTLYKMVDSVTDMGTRVTDIPVNIFTYTDVLTGAQNTYKARLQKL
jgi:hypothetical protein